jgi:cytochrome c-type biogenesis protein CcmH/NrfG
MLAFLVAATVDWTWQLPVLPAAFMLLAAAVLAPAAREVSIRLRSRDQAPDEPDPAERGRRIVPRVAFVVAALACLVVIAIPLGTTSAERQSQAAAAVGNAPLAVKDARSAVRLQPGAASAQLQLALALELQRDLPGAVAAAAHATRDEPQNWSDWLVLSRLQAESGHASAAIAAYRTARALNPRSPLFER